MKKKLLALLLIFAIAASMIACKDASVPSDTANTVHIADDNAQPEQTAQPTQTPAPEQTPQPEPEETIDYEKLFRDGMDRYIAMDLDAALDIFTQLSDAGIKEASFMAGYILCSVLPEDKADPEKARLYYELVQDEVPFAKLNLGFMYLEGYGVEADTDKAKALFDETVAAIDESKIDELTYREVAYYMLGLIYQNGYGVEPDLTKAIEWYQKAADLDNSFAISNVGYMYSNGLGVDQDYAKALEWYQKAADLGDILAIANVGVFYHYGLGVDRDYAKALEWYQKAADLASSFAMDSIGVMYFYGEGVEEDLTKAAEWFEKVYGEAGAMWRIGDIYQNWNADYAKAMEWYEKASDLGYEYAMCCLGSMYENGEGVKKNKAKAKEWYQKAADLGDTYAQECLDERF